MSANTVSGNRDQDRRGLLLWSHSRELAVHGQTSLGRNTLTRWQSSGYDEWREYGKSIFLGRGPVAELGSALDSPCPVWLRFAMHRTAFITSVSFSSPKDEISRSRERLRPCATAFRTRDWILAFNPSDRLPFTRMLHFVSRLLLAGKVVRSHLQKHLEILAS